MPHRFRLIAAVAALAVSGAALTGCSLLPDPLREIVEQGTEGAEVPFTSVPEDFPSEVPLIDGDVLVGLKPTETSWGVTIQVADEAAVDEAAQLLTDAGFVEQIEGTKLYDNGTYLVTLQAGPSGDGGYAIAYVVTTRAS